MSRHRPVLAFVLLQVLLSCQPSQAQDAMLSEGPSYALEVRAHRWLAEVRSVPGVQPAPFTTDGCSGGMSSLWAFTAEHYPAFADAHEGRPPWEDCCVAHDRVYHAGGFEAGAGADSGSDPAAGYAARLAADEALRHCVVATVSERDPVLRELYGMTEAQVRLVYASIGAAMFHAVRLGGGPCTGLPWRWGYGYPHCWEAVGE
jgi:hypothetical protein